MSNLFWLSDEQMARVEPFFLKSRGRPKRGIDHDEQEARHPEGRNILQIVSIHTPRPINIIVDLNLISGEGDAVAGNNYFGGASYRHLCSMFAATVACQRGAGFWGGGYLKRVGVVGMLASIAAWSRDICSRFFSYLLFLERLGSLFLNETGMNVILG